MSNLDEARLSARRYAPRCDVGTIERLLTHGHAHDVTPYARSIGYGGPRRVLVMDGKVITHRRMDWFAFCAMCRCHARRAACAVDYPQLLAA